MLGEGRFYNSILIQQNFISGQRVSCSWQDLQMFLEESSLSNGSSGPLKFCGRILPLGKALGQEGHYQKKGPHKGELIHVALG